MPRLDDRIASLEAKLKGLRDKQQAQERAARQAERQRTKKAEARRKFALGGLVKVAGLFDLDAGAFLGALLSVRPSLDDPARFHDFKRAGDALLAQRERDRKEQRDDQPETYLR